MYTIEVQNEAGEVLARAEGIGDARLYYREPYQEGDKILFTSPQPYAALSVDQAVETAEVFLPEHKMAFTIPFGDAKNGFPRTAFIGDAHALFIRPLPPETRAVRRNIALNPIDQRGYALCFPHAEANVETRGEAQFFARNAIDGHRFNNRHGGWPYHSWGIGQRTDAWLRIDFGRTVRIDEVALVLRADFPHDAWWQRITLVCSDGSAHELPLVKTVEVQRFPLGERDVQWVMLQDMVKADDPSPYPALTQIEVYGWEE
ncbi:MAG: discoidin domain-containing protein [Oscillospiraceae bacterium]|jgi:hypothetical protein|nr:discoidin domain-containing protein [Oscillospiraceae bacterium]